ncbi:hypothetical protein KOW79_015809 [Hemibagrus wyckioides]|uniref:Uncharacterized protein n=1 Tax=Hemibagrus wyckioides TaxID=337641 RepID=A0A9D3SJH5_9TELE|nr:hypothetical protein KOW79_015809 [Hemibagrus wyckioides]
MCLHARLRERGCRGGIARAERFESPRVQASRKSAFDRDSPPGSARSLLARGLHVFQERTVSFCCFRFDVDRRGGDRRRTARTDTRSPPLSSKPSCLPFASGKMTAEV